MSSKPKAPFKSRPAAELIKYVETCLSVGKSLEEQVDLFHDVMVFLVDMDSDCNTKLMLEKPSENPTGLTPEAMLEKMDILLHLLTSNLARGFSDDFFVGLLEIFENSVLKLHQPHYVQFVTYFAASTSRKRADDFLSLLLNIVHDDKSDPIARREAISFIGSFVCRATFLGGTHSARTGKYLVSFMHGLDISRSSSDRLVFVLALQTVCYMICWECNRWKDILETSELDWIWRSKKGLIAVLNKVRKDGVLRLVAFDILSMLQPLAGRVSVQLEEHVSEAIATYKQLLPPLWKPLIESQLLKPHFPFDPFKNLIRAGPLFASLVREWTDPGTAPNAPDGKFLKKNSSYEPDRHTTDESSQEDVITNDNDLWSFHPITAALLGTDYRGSPFQGPHDEDLAMLCSPLLMPQSSQTMTDMDIGENIVLSRILSSKTFAPAP